MATIIRLVHRTDVPKEINLKNFYQLSNQQRSAHIDALKQLPFDQLSETDLGVVFFYYQNWLLEDWPGKKVNFFEVKEIPQQVEQIDTGTSILEETDKLIEEIPTYTKEYLIDYLNDLFENYPNWRNELKFSSSVENFIDATNNIYEYIPYEKEIIREYSRR
jgi:hypothetical protein